jgi:UDP-N-acetyl-D-glucosamine dehydrogenase
VNGPESVRKQSHFLSVDAAMRDRALHENGNGSVPAGGPQSPRTIGIVGLGYVGLPLAVAFCEAGHTVVGVDVDRGLVERLRRGESPIEDVSDQRLRAIASRFHPTARYADLSRAEAVLIAVPTPLTPNREPDLGALTAAGSALATVLQEGQLVALESTTYPGYTRERFVPLLEESGLAAGTDFSVAFSPERIDPGRTDHTLATTPKVVGGLTPRCLERASAVYGQVCERIVPVASLEAAELTKLLENIFRSVNIALVNELSILCDRMGIDIWEVVDAASTKPYGFMRFEPGPGMGGHCLPVDPFYLAWRAREFDFQAEFIELAGEVNQGMPYFCVERIARALDEDMKPVRGSEILIMGVSYKAGVGDLRESPALKIMRLLASRGAKLRYHDDYVPELPEFGLSSMPLAQALDGSDCAAIVTAHPELDLERIAAEAPLLVDFRGVTRRAPSPVAVGVETPSARENAGSTV